MKKFITIILIFTCVLLKAQTTINYTSTDLNFRNTERGFYEQFGSEGSDPKPLGSQMQSVWITNPHAFSLILRMHYLDTFKESEISEDYLNLIRGDFETMKYIGIKCILRFAYGDESPDASKEMILQHIEQLRPILQENSDLIYVIQAGFIGHYGEWHSTAHPELNLVENQREIVDSLLSALPKSRMIQVRTPGQKQSMFQVEPIEDSQGFNESNISRIGFHNDCFLSSWSDYGTYLDIDEQHIYMAQETKFLPTGGEICNYYAPRTNCIPAIKEMELLHWSYLNRYYNTDALDSLSEQGCFEEVTNRLGHRFSLQTGIYPNSVEVGHQLEFTINLTNEGFASLVNPRTAYLVLAKEDADTIYQFPLTENPRYWLPGEHSISESITLPSDMELGNYKMYLFLPDESERLANLPFFSIRFANENVWDSTSGYNDLLHTIQVKENTNSINSLNNNNNICVFPNPAKNILTVNYAKGANISIINALGQEILSINNADEYQSVDISNLKSGTYFINILGEDFLLHHKLFISK
ncbi:MAG: DUF4832 domain-containing protein [Bacteroidales bacterium]|jgi:hypothetical protein|nr:DUF4832 domain-containing protein [Bacteroidales bacterium]